MTPWILGVHLISVICWFAGLFYLPRLFVYHAQTEDSKTRETFKVMEYKLYYYIMHPSLLMTLISGYWLLYTVPLIGNWIHVKLVLVFFLIMYHGACAYYLKRFQKDLPSPSHVFFRWFNEVPTVLLISIVLLATVQPLFDSVIFRYWPF